MVIKVKSSELDSLKIYLSCPKKKDCDDNCCQKAQEVLENGSVPSIRQIATQILVLHEFEFSASILENKDCLLAYLQVEEISKVISFLTKQDVDVLTSFNVQELDLILNRFKKSFAKNPKLFLPENVFEKFWSSLFYTGVDTWKNWRRVFTTLLELKKDDALVSDDFNTKLFKRIHPNLPWMLKIKYQALTVLIPKVPKIILFESFKDISEQLTSAIATQELSLITGDLIQAFCLNFQGFWEKDHEFHQLFEYLVWMMFNNDFVLRSRTKILWIPRLLACHETKPFFQAVYDFCHVFDDLDKYFSGDDGLYQFTKEERRIYALLLTNKLIGEVFNQNLYEICCNFALFAKNSEILLLALSFLKKFISKFDKKMILKVFLVNFDSDIPEVAERTLELLKTVEFDAEVYEIVFTWLESEKSLFHPRQKFVISMVSVFPTSFFENKERIFSFLKTAVMSKKFGTNDLNQLLKNLKPFFDDELKEFWMKNCLEKRKNDIENYELFQNFCSCYGVDENYFDGNSDFQKYFPRLEDIKNLINCNELILQKFGSQKLGESIGVTSVVRKFTMESEFQEKCQCLESIKLDAIAVSKEKLEFVEPLILNCMLLTNAVVR